MSLVIEVNHLTRKYGSFTAVKDVSFSIPKGQIVGLLGHNGAGKTTTLKVLTGYLEPTGGQVRITGLDVQKDLQAIQAKIGYLPENSPLYPEMTVVQYLDYVADMRSLPLSEKSKAIKDAIEATDLLPKSGAKIATLSKGYKQRVGVAQAILHKPEILILDEPTNGLDPTQIQSMRKLIKNLSQSSTVILSTHIMQEVEAICDRALIILDGRLMVDSSLSDLKKGNCIRVSLNQELSQVKPAFESLNGIKEVSQGVQEEKYSEYLLEADHDDPEIIASIAKTAVDKGWSLYSLNQDQRDLETVFKEANRGMKGGEHV